jgi:aerobic carbon-monoxide dehydrogenase small subunit
VRLIVNGETHEFEVEPRVPLADALRDELGLTGTNLGCEHGVCGTCTVLLDGEAVRSCLVLAVQCDGASVRTVEGLADRLPDGERLHPLQQAFAREHGLQCGFCTPGFLMLAAGALEGGVRLDEDEEALEQLLASNLCRCTGYEGIRRAVAAAAREHYRAHIAQG